MNATDVRAALDEALREAAAEAYLADAESHVWTTKGDGGPFQFGCASHGEGLHCCLDPGHRSYGRMLDDLAARIAKRLP